MELHRTSGRQRLGLGLALTTMLLWAVLPFALQGVLVALDPFTITWARFAISSLLLGAILAVRRDLPERGKLRALALLLGIATLGLAANYVLSLFGLHWTSPSDSQVLIQLGPMLLGLGGIVVFRERPTRLQWAGFALLLLGLGCFFASRLDLAARGAERLIPGTVVIALASLTWAIYGLAQKQLLRRLSSAQVLLCVYVGCALVLTPFAEPRQLAGLDAVQGSLLAFAALNTLIAYGAFAESLAHWEASRVGAVLALSPLATLAVAALVQIPWPGTSGSAPLGTASWLGALLVVIGSITASLAGFRGSPPGS